jgi:hypothetical protein
MDSRKNAIDADHDFDFYLRHDIPSEQMRTMLKVKKMNEDKVEDMVNKLLDARERVKKYASKFIQKIETSYGYYDVPTIVKKAYKYCDKHKLSAAERDAVVAAAIKGDAYNVYNPLNEVKYSEMSKFMGIETPAGQVLNLQSKDYAVLSEVVKMYETSKILHMDIKNQLALYRDCALEAVLAKYDAARHNLSTHIHPVIMSLFLPQIISLDRRMLISNIGRVVLQRSTPYINKHIRLYDNLLPSELETEWELTCDIVYDPNSLAYFSEDTPITNMLKRFRIQIELWKNVLNLRQGKVYSAGYDVEDGITGLLRVLSQYDWTFFDSPEMYHVQDEGTILRKLLAVFSVRPLVARISSTTPVSVLNTSNLSRLQRTTFVRIPMVNVRLPVAQQQLTISNQPIPQPAQQTRMVTLSNQLQSEDFFFENRMLVPKNKNIIHCKDLLFFYVNRRYQALNRLQTNINFNYTVVPYQMNSLTQTAINDHPVIFTKQMAVGGQAFNLRSFVTIYRPPIDPQNAIAAGSSAIVLNTDQSQCYYYNPLLANIQNQDTNNTKHAITTIEYDQADINAESIGQRYGTVFTYSC